MADLDLHLSSGRRYGLTDMVGDAEKDAAKIAANSPVRQAARTVRVAGNPRPRRQPGLAGQHHGTISASTLSSDQGTASTGSSRAPAIGDST